jgi:hypothetical protein
MLSCGVVIISWGCYDVVIVYISGLSKLKGRVGELDGKGENGEEGRMQELEDAIAQVSLEFLNHEKKKGMKRLRKREGGKEERWTQDIRIAI